ncbi:MAG: tyrosine-type recombinase/integrase [Syntrophomonas sp.]
MLFSDAWQLYVADKTIEGYSTCTLKSYHLQLKLLVRYLGDIDIEDVTLVNLKTYLIEKGGHLKPSSLGARIRFIRAFFKWASDEGYCSSNPARKLREPRLGQRVPKAFSEEEAEVLREACDRPLEHALLEFFYSSGCRIGEVHGLNKEAINWENRSAIVIGKGDKEREVYFSIKAKIWMEWYLKERNDSDPAMFVTERAPHRMSIAEIRYIVKRVGHRTNLDIRTFPHRWRHTFATHMLNRGAPLEGVQDQLGHVKIETTKIYCQLSGARRKEIHNRYF